MACTNHHLRADCLQWISASCPEWKDRYVSEIVYDALAYVTWFTTRGIKLRSIILKQYGHDRFPPKSAAEETAALPTDIAAPVVAVANVAGPEDELEFDDGERVETDADDYYDVIVKGEKKRKRVAGAGNHDASQLHDILRLCPHLQHIEYTRNLLQLPEDMLFRALATMPFPCLNSLMVCASNETPDADAVEAALKVVGPQLIFVFLYCTLLPADALALIATYCPNVQRMEFSNLDEAVSMVDLGAFLKGSKNLETIEIYRDLPDNSNADIIAMITAAQSHFRKLTSHWLGQGIMDLVAILEACPWIQELRIRDAYFCRETSALEIQHPKQDAADVDLRRLIAATGPLLELDARLYDSRNLDDNEVRNHSMTKLATANANTLQYLTIRTADHLATLITIIKPCVNLIKLWIKECRSTCAILKVITRSCQNLESLQLVVGLSFGLSPPPTIGDVEMAELFTNCSCLQYLWLDNLTITYATLQAIVTHRVPLHTFSWIPSCCGDMDKEALNEEELLRFAVLAKEHKLLPVPRIVKQQWGIIF